MDKRSTDAPTLLEMLPFINKIYLLDPFPHTEKVRDTIQWLNGMICETQLDTSLPS